MSQETTKTSALERLADENGLAVALVDAASREIFVANNNSICRSLNPDGEFTTHCKAFCGTAFEEAVEAGSTTSFTCHAGLECRVVPTENEGKPLVAIVGRAFISAENYRRATTRAISGDWKDHSPAGFFENILLTGSTTVLDQVATEIEHLLPRLTAEAVSDSNSQQTKAGPSVIGAFARDRAKTDLANRGAEQTELKRPVTGLRDVSKNVTGATASEETSPPVSNIVARFNREIGLGPGVPIKPAIDESPRLTPSDSEKNSNALRDVELELPPAQPGIKPMDAPAADEIRPKSNEVRAAEARAWRSFFGSLLQTDYARASESILEFIALQHDLSALIWLEKNDNRLVNTAAYGEMKNRKLRLGIASDDKRLLEAAQTEMPLEIIERPKAKTLTDPRTMYLFPIGVGGEISAGIAVLQPVGDENIKRQIARICQSIAPQLEILRLRSEVARGESLSTAVRQFSESLRHIDAEDLWVKLTQNAAEMLMAERASLMVFDEKTKSLEIKALIGGRGESDQDEIVGARVARLVFEKNKPIIVPDVAKTGLPPAKASRQYKTPSFISCPLAIGGRTIGVMSFADKASGRPFDRGSLSLLQAVAPQIAVAIDRASLKEKAGKFEQLSVTDALTGLLNRRYIEARLSEEVKRSNRHGFPMSFMMIDVDHFKSYNDQYGHPAGDEALKLVGTVIRETLRGADVAARFGGEEFSILLPQTTREEAAAIGERLRSNIAETRFEHSRVTTSIGIASCSAELCSAVDIVEAADKALYEAKHRGRNRVIAFEQMRG